MFRVLAALALVSAAPAHADGFVPVTQKSQFLGIVADRELTKPMFSMTLKITPDGQIEGVAMGWPVTGNWDWQDGYFCRQMDWGGMEIPFNCQLVEVTETGRIRFTVDRGDGDSAAFVLK